MRSRPSSGGFAIIADSGYVMSRGTPDENRGIHCAPIFSAPCSQIALNTSSVDTGCVDAAVAPSISRSTISNTGKRKLLQLVAALASQLLPIPTRSSLWKQHDPDRRIIQTLKASSLAHLVRWMGVPVGLFDRDDFSRSQSRLNGLVIVFKIAQPWNIFGGQKGRVSWREARQRFQAATH